MTSSNIEFVYQNRIFKVKNSANIVKSSVAVGHIEPPVVFKSTELIVGRWLI